MKAIYYNDPAAFVLGVGGVKDARLVTLSAGLLLACSRGGSDFPVGASLDYGAEGQVVSIDWLNKAGTVRLTASGAIAREADAYQDNGGKICALPAESVSAWADETSYTVGDLVKPGTANEHFYKCTSAGTSAAAASEPTWPTDGSTVDDGTATWQDMGSSKFLKIGKTLQAASGDGSVIGVFPIVGGGITDIAE